VLRDTPREASTHARDAVAAHLKKRRRVGEPRAPGAVRDEVPRRRVIVDSLWVQSNGGETTVPIGSGGSRPLVYGLERSNESEIAAHCQCKEIQSRCAPQIRPLPPPRSPLFDGEPGEGLSKEREVSKERPDGEPLRGLVQEQHATLRRAAEPALRRIRRQRGDHGLNKQFAHLEVRDVLLTEAAPYPRLQEKMEATEW